MSWKPSKAPHIYWARVLHWISMKNLLKEKIRRSENCVGTFVELGHPDVTEILSRQGFD